MANGVLTVDGLPLGTADNGDGTRALLVTQSPAAVPQTLTQTYTASANMTTAAAITPAPASGEKIVAVGIQVSTDTAMNFSVQMETSANVLARVFLPANGDYTITLRLKGDLADKKLFGKASAVGNVSITAITLSEA